MECSITRVEGSYDFVASGFQKIYTLVMVGGQRLRQIEKGNAFHSFWMCVRPSSKQINEDNVEKKLGKSSILALLI